MEFITSTLAFLVFLVTLLGIPVFCLGYIATLVQAFRKNLGWGFASMFVPLVLFMFTAFHWESTRKSALVMYLGLLGHIGGLAMSAILAVLIHAI